MLKNMGFVVVALSLVAGCGGESPSSQAEMDREGALGEAFSHEHFQATFRMLEARGEVPDLAAATVASAGNVGGFVLSIPVSGRSATELRFQTRSGQSPEVSVREPLDEVEDQAALPVCGTYTHANSCTSRPVATAQRCANGPLYRYDRYTLRHFTNGWISSFETSFYDCGMLVIQANCFSTCSPVIMSPRRGRRLPPGLPRE